MFKQLTDILKQASETSVSMEEAERYAALFLHAQVAIGEQLKEADLDARLRKTGLKALKAEVYLGEVQKAEKKPSDTLLEQIINSTTSIKEDQEQLDVAEVTRDQLQGYMSIAREGHIYFRGIAKGSFGS